MASGPLLHGMVPQHLQVRSARIVLDSLAVQADIGFHEFEVGTPQRLLITIEIWLEEAGPPAADDPALAWDYDFVRAQVQEIATARRYNLQETLAQEVFERIATLRGVKALRIRTTKPDVYAEAEGIGVELASFAGAWPDS